MIEKYQIGHILKISLKSEISIGVGVELLLRF